MERRERRRKRKRMDIDMKWKLGMMLAFLLVICLQLVLPEGYPGLKHTGGIQFESSEYGPRENPMGGSSGGFHSGIDVACRVGTPVVAVSAGTVVVCAFGDKTFGRYVVVRDDRGIDVLYGHLSATWRARGTRVEVGTVLGLSGNSGQSTGPHLHIQVMMSVDTYLKSLQPPHVSLPPEDWQWRK